MDMRLEQPTNVSTKILRPVIANYVVQIILVFVLLIIWSDN